ncbi:MAG TPA: APC family permease [Actinomycetota bacterium]|nr:APC family permease [Actinomycetota bacterium]
MPGKESDGSGDTPNGHDPGSLRIPTTGSGGALSPSAELSPPTDEQLRALARAGAAWNQGLPALPRLPVDLDIPQESAPRLSGRWTRLAQVGEFQLHRGTVEAGRPALEPRSAPGRAISRLRWAVLGPPLRSSAVYAERMGKLTGLPILSSDLLSSVAYGPEALLTALAAGGAAALGLSLPIAAVLVLLMLAVGLSYRQTIQAYPSGAGSYIVASANLGERAGILAAIGLLIDYILTVSVSIAAGVAAITSAIPSLSHDEVAIGLAGIGLVTVGNLRGMRQAGYVFAIPTYSFVAMIYVVIVGGLIKVGGHGFHPVSPPHLNGTEALGFLLVGRAFASGATSMTGIEAVSNAIPSFKKPEARNALVTLDLMIVMVVSMFAGLMLIVHFNGLVPRRGETLLSQIGRAALGGGVPYAILQASTALILFLAANTAYNDFPRLLFFMAANDHAPRRFLRMGERLVFINGTLLLTVIAGGLFVIFRGQTESLIPLYAVGVFLAFTLSQAGMVRHWFRDHRRGWRWRAALNAGGAAMSGLVLVVGAVTKFVEGAWVVVVAIPALAVGALAVRRYYGGLRVSLEVDEDSQPASAGPVCDVPAGCEHLLVVGVSRMNRASLQALAYARSLRQPVFALHVSPEDEEADHFRQVWTVWGNHIPLKVVESPYRSVVLPMTHYIEALHEQRPELTITVVMGEVVARHVWERFLLSPLGPRLRRNLRSVPGVVVTTVPIHR